jgi:hypothetical protein
MVVYCVLEVKWTTLLERYLLDCNYYLVFIKWPVTVAERSKACTVFSRSEAAIVGSNSTQGMDV